MNDDPGAQFPLACQDYLDGKHGGLSPEADATEGEHLINALRKAMSADIAKEIEEIMIGRHKVVRSYDPKDWPYPPEPGCQEEYDEPS